MSSNSNESVEKEKKADVDAVEVHSANSWETANLGDKSRNEKFLRLMGASKKEHHGRFVIGDQDGKHRAKTDEKHMAEELEEQYKHSLEHSLIGGKKGHIGLGFHGESNTQKGEDNVDDKSKDKVDDDKLKDEDSGETKPTEKEGDSERKAKDDFDLKESGDRKRESVDKSGEEHEEVKKIKFVKSSS